VSATERPTDPEPAVAERPVGVAIIGVFYKIVAVLLLVSMVVLLGMYWAELPALIIIATAVRAAAFALVLYVCGMGLREGAKWAWYLASCISACVILESILLIVLLQTSRTRAIAALIINLIIYRYLLRAEVRGFLGLPYEINGRTFLGQAGIALAFALISLPIALHQDRMRAAAEQEQEAVVEGYRRAGERQAAEHRLRLEEYRASRAELQLEHQLRIQRLRGELSESMAESREAAQRQIRIRELLRSGNSRVSRRDIEGAIDDFTEALDLEPDLAVAYLNRGTAYAMEKDLNSARSDFMTASELDPRGPVGAQARRAMKMLDRARR
jgi:tetratricopeptide (TPR) repeat protein